MIRPASWLLRALRWLVAATVVFLAATVLGGLIAGPVGGPRGGAGHPAREVGLLAGAIHNDFVFPLDPDLRRRFQFAEQGGVPVGHPDARWLIVGWGARAFYTTTGTMADIAPGAVWRAVIGDASVLRVEVWRDVDLAGLPTYRRLALTEAQYQALIAGIEAEFARDRATGSPVLVQAPGFYEGDAFFAGRTRFHLFNTCNVWVGRQLRAAGIRFGIWTPATWSVNLSQWRFGQEQG
ncbi:TIGR02117 family protein [Frigidibacter sp. SD6-1]|uniref:TIGR02117 family protein n=1 Tax=Frigidibacter sp. SD6-1 TaxID=3032581 RepID=UPI0024DF5A68|nr:TIGR02117 family protein [Frigidibacter sp. SD6-1]